MRAHGRRFSVSKAVFNKVTSKSLIYNTAWEDPAVDLPLLELDQKSRVLMISGAGDNVLNYLLEGPASITAIDQNTFQSALLAIKAELIRLDEFDLLRCLFMQGRVNLELYQDFGKIVGEMELPTAKAYGERLVNLFAGGRSFYYRGSAGFVARMIREKMMSATLESHIIEYFESTDINNQRELYLSEIEPRLFSPKLRRHLGRDSFLSFLGVPRQQLASINQRYDEGLFGFLKDKLRHVFTTIPAQSNYFWQVYFFGGYSYDMPEYLKEENFEKLRANIDRLKIVTGNIYESDFGMKSGAKGFTHVNLLDSLDWFSDRGKAEYAFPSILNITQPKGRILFRSAHFEMGGLIERYKDNASFETSESGRVQDYHLKDRVGTYASLYLAEKK